jgi:hypothetical protein
MNGNIGQIQWLTRSPDITLLDYFLWGHLKIVVYENLPINLDDLKNKIIIACNELTEDYKENYLDEWKHVLKIMTIILNSLWNNKLLLLLLSYGIFYKFNVIINTPCSFNKNKLL